MSVSLHFLNQELARRGLVIDACVKSVFLAGALHRFGWVPTPPEAFDRAADEFLAKAGVSPDFWLEALGGLIDRYAAGPAQLARARACLPQAVEEFTHHYRPPGASGRRADGRGDGRQGAKAANRGGGAGVGGRPGRAAHGGQRRAGREQGRGDGGPDGPVWWEVLGVNPSATAEQIRAAYRKLALRHHPDRGGDEHLFKQVQAAFDQVKKLQRA